MKFVNVIIMTTVTIPKELAEKDDLIVIPRKEYESLLVLKKIRIVLVNSMTYSAPFKYIITLCLHAFSSFYQGMLGTYFSATALSRAKKPSHKTIKTARPVKDMPPKVPNAK